MVVGRPFSSARGVTQHAPLSAAWPRKGSWEGIGALLNNLSHEFRGQNAGS